MQIFKKILIFLFVNIIVVCSFSFLLRTPTHMELLVDEYHNSECNEVILGQSHGQASVNPFILSDEDSNAFNLCDGLMTLDDIYELLKEANKYDKVKKVYLDMDATAWNKTNWDMYKGEARFGNTNTIWHMSLKNKPNIQYLWNVSKKQNYNDLLFNYVLDGDSIITIPKRIKSLITLNFDFITEDEYIKKGKVSNIYEYQGKGFLYGIGNRNMKPVITSFSEDDVTPIRLKYFKKIVSYCEKNDIELICLTPALPPARLKNENQNDAHDYFTKLCNECGVKYIDFNYAKAEYLFRTDKDYIDKEGHQMGYLANKQTELLKDVLSSNNREQYFYDTYDEVLEGLKVKNGDAA